MISLLPRVYGKIIVFVTLLTINCPLVAAPLGYSGLPATTPVQGVKWPNSAQEGTVPVVTEDLALSFVQEAPGGYDQLLPYILAAPDQDEAGSCLYMSLTGIAEWWLARLNPDLSRAPDGPLDLSERYVMNLAGIDEDKDPYVPNWKTDSMFLFNLGHKSVLNSSYRFTKGWYTGDANHGVHPAAAGGAGASYGTMYNWIDDHAKINAGFVALPHFTRNIIFADPASNQWNVGVAPADIVGQVKNLLTENAAPVHVIYNHFGYWHAVMIVGYNDEMDNGGCSFVTRSLSFAKNKADQLRKEAEATTNPAAKEQLLKTAAKHEKTRQQLSESYQAQGGCHGSKGVFYVRDSIYAAPSEPMYHYDLSQPDRDSHYSKKVILHEYDWLLYLGNHVVQVGVAQ